ncbi:hypothetical protein FACS189490_11050 [Clostridia bacterium]|nr:hypothetical protein FACS189490_11050 [Clostridia bacterium]
MKLHLGCGKRYLPGWTHIDLAEFPHIDYRQPIEDLSNFETGSVEQIYACHCLEHFGRHKVQAVLNEWARVTKPGGVIHLAVPNMEAVVAHYAEHADLPVLLGFLVGGQNDDYDYHYCCFDFKFLKGLLENAGFVSVEKYDWSEFLPEGFDDYSRAYLPHMEFQNGTLMSLNVTARKA